MQHTIKSLIISGALILFSNAALAEQDDTSIPNLPNNSVVTISGSVDKVGTRHEFMLRNNSGIIEVRMKPEEPIKLKEDENVTVTGMVEKPFFGIFGNDIAATKVQLR